MSLRTVCAAAQTPTNGERPFNTDTARQNDTISPGAAAVHTHTHPQPMNDPPIERGLPDANGTHGDDNDNPTPYLKIKRY
jgi:hypothetical protein